MASISNEELIKRVAKLARQNQDLEVLVKRLERQNEKLILENEMFRSLSKTSSSDVISAGEADKKGKTLRFNMVTVLFADIHGFSKITDEADPATMMDELDEIFVEFSSIISRLKIEKIRSIGDTFM